MSKILQGSIDLQKNPSWLAICIVKLAASRCGNFSLSITIFIMAVNTTDVALMKNDFWILIENVALVITQAMI
jgi:hypothetical protein